MYQRICNLPKTNSFFLFGARGTGKSTLLLKFKEQLNSNMWIDLLDPETEKELSIRPSKLQEWIIQKGKSTPEWVIIDEIQKIPALLDVIHKLIFEHKVKFALTGSSARKLKRGNANMLAGRAFGFKLYPLSFLELDSDFDITHALQWGQLPAIFKFDNDIDKKRFLYSYVQNYIKEEILVEQLIRNIEPFRSFLEVAAQSNTEIINYAKLAREAGIDPKSVERYFEVLEDTLVGFMLPPYSKSIRKRQFQKPKFYFFDVGVTRALSNSLDSLPIPKTYGYGRLFEQLVILEAKRLNDYYERNYKFSYLRTKDNVEVDLVLEKGKETVLIEIKSTNNVIADDIRSLKNVGKKLKARKIVLCREKRSYQQDDIHILPWKEGLKEIFQNKNFATT